MTGPTIKSLLISALVVVATGAAGAALGLSGVLSAPTISAGIALTDARTTAAAGCVGGPTVATLDAGDRVVAVARSEDGDWIGVRAAAAPRTLWLPESVLTLDEGEPDTAALPVGGVCPQVVVLPDRPGPVETEEPSPGPEPDTTAPTLGTPTASPNPVNCAENTSIAVTAGDDRGVSRVDIAWSGYDSGSSTMTGSGSNWSFPYTPSNNDDPGLTTFLLTAFDSAGNASIERSVVVNVNCIG